MYYWCQYHMQILSGFPKSCETINSRLDNISHTQKWAAYQKPIPMCLHGDSTRSMTSRLRLGTMFRYVLNCFPNLGTWISNLDGGCKHARERENQPLKMVIDKYREIVYRMYRSWEDKKAGCINKCAFVWMDESNKTDKCINFQTLIPVSFLKVFLWKDFPLMKTPLVSNSFTWYAPVPSGLTSVWNGVFWFHIPLP